MFNFSNGLEGMRSLMQFATALVPSKKQEISEMRSCCHCIASAQSLPRAHFDRDKWCGS